MLDEKWLLTAFSLYGNVLNVKRRRSCFIVWVIANLLWLAYDLYSGLYSRAALDIVQTGFCIWGFIEWRSK